MDDLTSRATHCAKHTTAKESTAYYIGTLDGYKNAQREAEEKHDADIRMMARVNGIPPEKKFLAGDIGTVESCNRFCRKTKIVATTDDDATVMINPETGDKWIILKCAQIEEVVEEADNAE